MEHPPPFAKPRGWRRRGATLANFIGEDNSVDPRARGTMHQRVAMEDRTALKTIHGSIT